jgi:5-methylcytosine-specific restriction endonuclease McrA
MKHEKIDAVEVCKELEDDLAPRLKLTVIERTVYYHLLRHTRLEGKLRRRFTIAGLAVKLRLSRGPVRNAIRRLADHGMLRLVARSYSGHLVEVRLPAEVRAARRKKLGTDSASQTKPLSEPNLEEVDFLRSTELRQAIHAREGGRCFYCRRRIPGRSRCLDHVVPQARSGQNSYRNLVSCCVECNWKKKDNAPGDFLRELYREGSLSRKELGGRLRALQALAAGKLRPQVFHGENAASERSG